MPSAVDTPPRSTARESRKGLFAHPPSPTTLRGEGAELLTGLISLEPIITLNEAFCERALLRCPPSDELHRECAKVRRVLWQQRRASGCGSVGPMAARVPPPPLSLQAHKLSEELDAAYHSLKLPDPCSNINPQCEPWAASGECDKTAGYMWSNCRLACKWCTPRAGEQQVVGEEPHVVLAAAAAPVSSSGSSVEQQQEQDQLQQQQQQKEQQQQQQKEQQQQQQQQQQHQQQEQHEQQQQEQQQREQGADQHDAPAEQQQQHGRTARDEQLADQQQEQHEPGVHAHRKDLVVGAHADVLSLRDIPVGASVVLTGGGAAMLLALCVPRARSLLRRAHLAHPPHHPLHHPHPHSHSGGH